MAIAFRAIEVCEEPLSELRHHVAVPSSFLVETALDVLESAAGFELRERKLAQPYRKDYDSIEYPLEWLDRFDTSRWTLIGAFDGNTRIGGIVGAFGSPELEMLEGRNDLVVLWDLRVAPDARRRGVGTTLFRALETWARLRGCTELKVETQNINAAACRFYAQQGCQLSEANRAAYPDLPEEVQLIWRKVLD
jgi:GNAT superfamily N-acetyltransferase